MPVWLICITTRYVGWVCVWEGPQKAQWQSLQPANFIKEDGSGRATELRWVVVAEGSSIFFPLVSCNKSSLGFSLRTGFTLQSVCSNNLLERAHYRSTVLPSCPRAPLIVGGSTARAALHFTSSRGLRSLHPGNGVLPADTWGQAKGGASTSA